MNKNQISIGGKLLNREFLCIHCGLFFFEKIDYKTTFSYSYKCPNCHNENIGIFAVDTFGFAMWTDNHREEYEKVKKWSSIDFAPDWALEIYKKQGVEIRE